MTPGLVGYALVAGSLVGVAALSADGACRLARAPVRWVWAAALALTIGLVATAPLRLGPIAVAVDLSAGTAAILPAGTDGGAAGLAARVREVVEAGAGWVPGAAEGALAIVWPAVSALLLLVLAGTHRGYGRRKRRWPTVELHGTPVRVSPSTGPAVVGWLRPAIVVPGWLLRLGAEEQRLVLSHEREHIRGRDPLLLGLGCLAVALLPWHPAAWWMLARLRLAVELDCDARVLRTGIHPARYGGVLIDLAGRGAGGPLGVPALADHPSHLQRRIVAMTPSRRRLVPARAAALAALATVALVVACEARLPTSAEIEKMDVASAETALARTGALPESAAPTYVVDGVTRTAEEAHAIVRDRIVAIEVSHPEAGGGPVIRIDTETPPTPPTPPTPAVPATPPTPVTPVTPGVEPAPPTPPTPPAAHATSPDRFAGLLFIDGVAADHADLAKLDKNLIASIEVVKGAKATELSSDPRAVNGIIRVTTKR